MRGKSIALAVKRLLDVVTALLALTMLSPVFVVAAGTIRMTMGSPVLFTQIRPGKEGKPFLLYKFRTMNNRRGEDGQLLPDKDRLTNIGILLRRTSIDELPQLINVLWGDMSLVGPRPLLMKYVPYFTEEELLRQTVRPGITGLAQISGRNLLSWDERLALDVQYVKTWSLVLDLKILCKTVAAVVNRKGVVAATDTVLRNLDEERKDKLGN